jgi:nicotinic acid mononucleotide adenylyltransferase
MVHTATVAIAAYPGSFDPPTVAHLAIAEAAHQQCGVDRVDLVLSEEALGKEGAHHVRLTDRVAVVRAVAATRPWLGVVVTRHRILADIGSGYDVIVMGADKWAQVVDPAWYGSAAARDDALARLPVVAVARRPGFDVPDGVVALDVDLGAADVSSTAVRAGTHGWFLPEAASFAAESGAWIEPERYERWLAGEDGAAD